MADGGYLVFNHQKGTKTQNNYYFLVFGMLVLVEVGTLIIRLAHIGPDTWI